MSFKIITVMSIWIQHECCKSNFNSRKSMVIFFLVIGNFLFFVLLNFLFISITIDTNISSHDSRIINIKARKCLLKNELQESALPVQLNSDPQFAYDLLSAYDIYMQ